jgi:hypothetical protein
MTVVVVIIEKVAIDLIAFCKKYRLLERLFMVGNDLKNVVIDQQSRKQCAEVNQRKAKGLTRQFV